MQTLSIGICAYNERENIGQLIRELLKQRMEIVLLKQIIVVASGCTDGTEDIVKEFAKGDKRVMLIKESERGGKSRAVNTFLKKTQADIIVLISADTLPQKNAIEELVKPLLNKKIGMTGGHPVPINSRNTFMGFLAHFMWDLHHEIALKEPKLGEMVAFKNIVRKIPSNSAVDEASIEAIIRTSGLSIEYCPKALVNNKGPETLSDFLKQRRRIYAGHLWLKETSHYSVSTMSGLKILGLVLENLKNSPCELFYTIIAVNLEMLSRFLGFWDYKVLKTNPAKWEIASSTKHLTP